MRTLQRLNVHVYTSLVVYPSSVWNNSNKTNLDKLTKCKSELLAQELVSTTIQDQKQFSEYYAGVPSLLEKFL